MPNLSIDPAETNAFRAINSAWKANATVSRAGDRYVISGLTKQASTELVTSLAIHGQRVAAAGTPIKKPRIALFEPPNSMDAGWAKWVLERYGFEFASVNTPDIAGNLKDRIDVLVHRRRSARHPSGRRLWTAHRRRRQTMMRASSHWMRSSAAVARWSR